MLSAVIQKIVQAVENGQTELEILSDISARREFMYAGGSTACIWQVVERFNELPDLMKVGLGKDYSVKEYYQATAKVVVFKGVFKLTNCPIS